MEQVMKKIPAILLAGLIAVAAAFAIGAFTVQEAHAADLGEEILYVGGKDIVKEGGTVTGDNGQGTAKLSYDGDGNPVLTLSDFKCENCTGGSPDTYYAVIQNKGDAKLTIQMNGENAVKPADGQKVHDGISCDGPLVIEGEGSLKVTNVDNNPTSVVGINCHGELQIESGNITVTTEDGDDVPLVNYAIASAEIITINGGTVKASSGNATNYSYGIYSRKGVEINGGDVTASTDATSASYKMGIVGDWVTIGGDITRVEAVGPDMAIFETLKNYVPGKGWDNTAGTGDAAEILINKDGAELYYQKMVFEPKLDISITGNSSTVTYNAKEQSVSGYTVKYNVGDGNWIDEAPAGVSVKLKDRFTAEAKGTDVKTYKMGLTADSFDISWGYAGSGKLNVTDGALTIEKAPLTITALDQTYVYNGYEQGEGDPAYDDPAVIAKKVTASGLQGNDVLTSLVMTGTAKEIGVYPGRIQATGSAVGNATQNYAITYVDGTLTITPIPIAVTVGGSSAKKTYNGKQQTYKGTVTATSKDKAFDASKFRYTGSTVVKGTKAGTYTKKLTDAGCAYNDPHYALKVTIGSPVKLTIKKAAITIKADSKKSKYGKPLKKLTYKVSGAYVKSDKLGVRLSTTAKKNKPGTYAIKVSWNKNPNYKVTLANGKYKVTGAPSQKVSGILISKLKSKGKRKLVLTWSKIKGAQGYDVFFARCGKTAPKKVKTIKGNKTFRWTKKILRKKTAYKAVVKAYVIKNGKKTYIRTSPMVHAYTSGGKVRYTNAKSVTVKKTAVSLKKGRTFKIKARVNKLQKGKKLMPECHTPKLRYISSNRKIATVSKSGRITAKSKGSCRVCVISASGAGRTIKVTVR